MVSLSITCPARWITPWHNYGITVYCRVTIERLVSGRQREESKIIITGRAHKVCWLVLHTKHTNMRGSKRYCPHPKKRFFNFTFNLILNHSLVCTVVVSNFAFMDMCTHRSCPEIGVASVRLKMQALAQRINKVATVHTLDQGE